MRVGTTIHTNADALVDQFVGLAPGRPSGKIAVTGGSGFIGTNLIDFYRASGVGAIVNWDIVPPRNPQHADLWRKLDIREPQAVERELLAYRPEILFHLGARTDLQGGSLSDYSANTTGVANVIASALALSPAPRIIFASSRMVCRIGHQPKAEDDYSPPNAYGESKVETERIVRREAGADLQWILVRPTSIWGPWFEIPYRDFFETVSHGRYIHPQGKRILKSFGFVGNTVYQLDRLMFASAETVERRTIYLGDYPPLEVYSWATQIAQMAGRRLYSVPMAVLQTMAKIGDLAEARGVHRVPLTSFRLSNLLTEMVHDMGILESVVGPLPFSLERSTELTFEWVRNNPLEVPWT